MGNDSETTFTITDESGLAWYARKIAAIDGEANRIQAQAKAMLADLDLEREREALQFQFGQQAENVTRHLLEERGGRAKHIKTLYGNLGYRTKPARLEISNHAALLEWTSTNAPELVETRVTATKLLERFKVSSAGDVVFDLSSDAEPVALPGVVLHGAQEAFYIKAGSSEE
jgi:hypothetical protein